MLSVASSAYIGILHFDFACKVPKPVDFSIVAPAPLKKVHQDGTSNTIPYNWLHGIQCEWVPDKTEGLVLGDTMA
jgi:hypothetical protein